MMLPLVPEDVRPRPPLGGEARSFIRAATAVVLAVGKSTAEEEARQRWPRDLDAGRIAKAATSPTSTANAAAVVPTSVRGFFEALVLSSAAARLFTAARLVDLAGVGVVSIPYPVSTPAPPFVGEG